MLLGTAAPRGEGAPSALLGFDYSILHLVAPRKEHWRSLHKTGRETEAQKGGAHSRIVRSELCGDVWHRSIRDGINRGRTGGEGGGRATERNQDSVDGRQGLYNTAHLFTPA